MKKQSYIVIYEEDPEGGFVASVPSLPSCYSQGVTLEEAEANITEAIELYLETLHEESKELPEGYGIWQGRVEIAV